MKQAYLCFLYSERLKSNLILAATFLDQLSILEGERLKGGREIVRGFSNTLHSEISLAKQYLPEAELKLIETKVDQMEQEIERHNYQRAQENLSQALTRATTLCTRYMNVLEES